MNEHKDNGTTEQQRAREALAMMREHQERTERAAGMPVWIYPAMFVLSAGASAANDFVNLTGTKVIAAVIALALVVVLGVRMLTGAAPLSLARGVAARQSPPNMRVQATVLLVLLAGVFVIARYGTGLGHSLADALGVPGYPHTVTGVTFAAVATVLFALGQRFIAASGQRSNR